MNFAKRGGACLCGADHSDAREDLRWLRAHRRTCARAVCGCRAAQWTVPNRAVTRFAPRSPLRWEAWQAYGEWFEGLPWDLFATFTMPDGATLGALDACHRRWSKIMRRENGGELRQVLAVEYQRNGTPHGHALVYGIAPGNEAQVEGWHAAKLWERVGGGHARVWPYQGAGGAASYCAKYVTKDGDVRLLGPWASFSLPDKAQPCPC